MTSADIGAPATADLSDRGPGRSGARLLTGVFRTNARLLGAGIAGAVAWQTAGLAVPIVTGRVIDGGVVGGHRSTVWWGALALFLLSGIEILGARTMHRASCRAEERCKLDLRGGVVAAALADDAPPSGRLAPGELLGRATGDIDALGSFLESSGYSVAHLLSIPTVVVVLAFIDWPVAAAIGILMPMLIVAMWRYSTAWSTRTEHVRAAFDATTASVEELVEGFRVASGLGVGDVMAHRSAVRSQELLTRSVRRARLWLLFEPLVEALSLIAIGVVVGIGGVRAIDDQLTVGELVTSIGLAVFLIWPVRSIGEQVVNVQTTLASASRLVGVIERCIGDVGGAVDDADDDGHCAIPEGARRPIDIDLVDAVVSRDGSPILAGVSIRLRPGDVAFVSGGVGVGKSSLLSALVGDVELDGPAQFGGVDAARWSSRARRYVVQRVGPEPFLFAGTIADNVRFGRPEASDRAIRRALQVVDALDFVDRLADGIHTVIGERGTNLSGGQRQRVAIARAVLAAPDVLLLDAATSAVEPDRELRILEAVTRLFGDRIVAVVSNHPDVRRLANIEFAIGEGTVTTR